MEVSKAFELPADLQRVFYRAIKLEWVTLGYLCTVVILMYFVMGNSQAMKSAWLEDLLSMLPAASFLVASRIYHRKPNDTFPYGYHRAFGIAYFAGAMALSAMGLFLAIDSLITLFRAEHPTIGSVSFFGMQLWMGWLMILVLLYSAIPVIFLGRAKLPMAKRLHNKILFTDASAQKADYMTAFAAIFGVLGIGMGLWWTDSAAALFISFSIVRDGIKNLVNSVRDLADRRPVHIEDDHKEELIGEAERLVSSWAWVTGAKARFCEHGQVYFGEIFVVPAEGVDLPAMIEKGVAELKEFHWKLHDIVITPVRELPQW